jgi:hypothetical protein
MFCIDSLIVARTKVLTSTPFSISCKVLDYFASRGVFCSSGLVLVPQLFGQDLFVLRVHWKVNHCFTLLNKNSFWLQKSEESVFLVKYLSLPGNNQLHEWFVLDFACSVQLLSIVQDILSFTN